MLITPVWQQITDGAQDVTIQVLRGVIYLLDSRGQPDSSANKQVVTEWIRIVKPAQIWVRSPWSKTHIDVTTYAVIDKPAAGSEVKFMK